MLKHKKFKNKVTNTILYALTLFLLCIIIILYEDNSASKTLLNIFCLLIFIVLGVYSLFFHCCYKNTHA